MSRAMIIIIVIIGIALVCGVYLTSAYNGMVTMSENIDSQWAIVESKLQRRFDLIPNLVNSVKGIMDQEKEVFDNITDAREKLAGATTTTEQVNASTQVDGALNRLLVVMENYPELRSVESVNNLMDELAGAENRISVERDRYNLAVKEYNSAIRRFPKNLIARPFGFTSKPYFESSEGAQKVPEVKL